MLTISEAAAFRAELVENESEQRTAVLDTLFDEPTIAAMTEIAAAGAAEHAATARSRPAV
ncbi:MAG: hypothetical protein IZT58_14795 [Actinobacteria bacterium]|jgi:hypothetical protein|nr:hypothetical protein [Actinomycetota bacterium]